MLNPLRTGSFETVDNINVDSPDWPFSKLYEPVSGLLTNAVYLCIHSTSLLFDSQDLLPAVNIIESIENRDRRPAKASIPLRDFTNALRTTGEITNSFLHHLDQCLDLLIDDSQVFDYRGILSTGIYDEHTFFFDSLYICQRAQAYLPMTTKENSELLTKFRDLSSNIATSIAQIREETSLVDGFFHRFLTLGKRNASKIKVLNFWSTYSHNKVSDPNISEAQSHIEEIEKSLKLLVFILKAASGGKVPGKEYYAIAHESEPVFRMLAYKHSQDDWRGKPWET